MAFASQLRGLRQPTLWPSPANFMAFASQLHGLRQPTSWPLPASFVAFASQLHSLCQLILQSLQGYKPAARLTSFKARDELFQKREVES
jgi:hypothetical protein